MCYLGWPTPNEMRRRKGRFVNEKKTFRTLGNVTAYHPCQRANGSLRFGGARSFFWFITAITLRTRVRERECVCVRVCERERQRERGDLLALDGSGTRVQPLHSLSLRSPKFLPWLFIRRRVSCKENLSSELCDHFDQSCFVSATHL